MRSVSTTTEVSGHEYPITYLEFDSVPEALAKIGNVKEEEIAVEAPPGALQAVLSVINAAQKQGATQGGKELPRKAGEEHGFDSEEYRKAVEAHQQRAAKYVIGAGRGPQGGVTKTKARELGAKLRERLGDEALLALAREHGIDPAELGITAEGTGEGEGEGSEE